VTLALAPKSRSGPEKYMPSVSGIDRNAVVNRPSALIQTTSSSPAIPSFCWMISGPPVCGKMGKNTTRVVTGDLGEESRLVLALLAGGGREQRAPRHPGTRKRPAEAIGETLGVGVTIVDPGRRAQVELVVDVLGDGSALEQVVVGRPVVPVVLVLTLAFPCMSDVRSGAVFEPENITMSAPVITGIAARAAPEQVVPMTAMTFSWATMACEPDWPPSASRGRPQGCRG
jgi:hypothetical protein